MFISKGSYGYGESKKVFFQSLQKPHLPVRDSKRPPIKQVSVVPTTEIWGNTGLPFAMVPCLHQGNICIKRKLRVWRVQKYIPLVGANTSLTCAGLQTTPSQESQYRAENGNLRYPVSNFCHGTVLAPKHCLYQKEATGMESPKLYSSRQCKNLTYLWGTANDPVSSEPV